MCRIILHLTFSTIHHDKTLRVDGMCNGVMHGLLENWEISDVGLSFNRKNSILVFILKKLTLLCIVLLDSIQMHGVLQINAAGHHAHLNCQALNKIHIISWAA